MSPGHLVIRADADSCIGTGHVMRCCALASAWSKHGGRVTFITATSNPHIQRRIEASGAEVVALGQRHPHPEDLVTTLSVLEASPGAWAVLDGYHFDTNYQLRVRSRAGGLMCIDDYACLEHYPADILLNQNISAASLKYSLAPYTTTLLGSKFALLSDSFLKYQDWQREVPTQAKKVLVTLGGSDPDNQTLKVVRALESLRRHDLEIKVVVGATNPNLETLKTEISRVHGMTLLQAVDDMPRLMAWADLAVSAGGSTCWELAFMGLPNLIMVLARNQAEIAAGLHQAGISENLGWFQDVSEGKIAQRLEALISDQVRRSEMGRLGRELVDGNGAERVVKVLRERQGLQE